MPCSVSSLACTSRILFDSFERRARSPIIPKPPRTVPCLPGADARPAVQPSRPCRKCPTRATALRKPVSASAESSGNRNVEPGIPTTAKTRLGLKRPGLPATPTTGASAAAATQSPRNETESVNVPALGSETVSEYKGVSVVPVVAIRARLAWCWVDAAIQPADLVVRARGKEQGACRLVAQPVAEGHAPETRDRNALAVVAA